MLKEWITNVIVCTILFSVILYLVPDPNMKKYIQTAVGFVMMIVVITPVIKCLNYDGKMVFNMYQESAAAGIGENDVYENLMESMVQNFLENRYGMKSEVDIVMGEKGDGDEYTVSIESMNVHIPEGFRPGREKIAAAISREYDLSRELVNVN